MTDILKDKKLVHVKLDKDTHSALRSALFKAGLTMQEILSEFCRLYIDESPHAVKIVEGYVNKKNRYKIQAVSEGKKPHRHPQYGFSGADKAVLYDILDENSPLHQKAEGDDV